MEIEQGAEPVQVLSEEEKEVVPGQLEATIKMELEQKSAMFDISETQENIIKPPLTLVDEPS